ncbi:hypothetical protein FRC00_005299, partial [Tulasnella sp. 408]
AAATATITPTSTAATVAARATVQTTTRTGLLGSTAATRTLATSTLARAAMETSGVTAMTNAAEGTLLASSRLEGPAPVSRMLEEVTGESNLSLVVRESIANAGEQGVEELIEKAAG